MIDYTTWGIEELERELRVFTRTALPYAVKHALSATAFDAMRRGRANVGSSMTLRNKWTEGSVRALPVRTNKIDAMVSRMGSAEDYMRVQETGGIERTTGRYGLPIPTGYSAGQEGRQPRTKLPRKANQMRNIRLQTKWATAGSTDRQRLVRVVQEAVATGKRFVFLRLARGDGGGHKSGIFRVIGGRKNTRRGWPSGAKIKMIHNLEHKTVRIPKNVWNETAAILAAEDQDEHYRKALIFQIERNRLFRNR